MLNEEIYTKEWILSSSGRHTDVRTLEKVIYAFTLLEMISQTEIPFVFKGGTCLSLLANELKRFSVDIDIITNENQYDLFENIFQEKKILPFKRYEEDFRIKRNIIKKHFKFYYDSEFSDNEQYVLLDVVFENIDLDLYNYKSIDLEFLKIDKPLTEVRVPN